MRIAAIIALLALFPLLCLGSAKLKVCGTSMSPVNT